MGQWIETAIAIATRLATGYHWALPGFGGTHRGLASDALRCALGLAVGMGIAVALAACRGAAARK